METVLKLNMFVLAVAALATSACAVPLGPEEEVTDSEAQSVLSSNALTSNALTSNSLTAEELTAEELTSNALTAEALASNALTAKALRDPAARAVMRYIAACALPAGDRLDVEVGDHVYTFAGELGLATGWASEGGACDAQCRSWISGCVLARLNYRGEKVPISVRGDRAELETDKAERLAFTRREATYYGDIFAPTPLYYACLSPEASAIPRVCGPSLGGCVMDVVGSCDDVCDAPKRDGSFPNCRDEAPGAPGKRELRRGPYTGSITVFLH